MAFTRFKQGRYIAIYDEDWVIEVNANSKNDAKEIATGYFQMWKGKSFNGNVTVAAVPCMLGCID